MNKIKCTIYDCEFDFYHAGIFTQDMVYILDENGELAQAKGYICEHVDFDMVQFYIGEYDESNTDCSKDTCKWGYFSFSTGRVVIPPIYDYAGPFYGDRAWVTKNLKCGLINPYGKVVVDILWDELGSTPLENIYWVKKCFKFGYIDKNGLTIFKPQFEKITRFKFVENEYGDFQYEALVMKDGKYGFINEKLKYMIEPKFINAKEFCKLGYALVMENEKWQVIGRDGHIIDYLQFDEVGESSVLENGEFYIVRRNSIWGILDSDYNFIAPDEESSYVVFKGRKIFLEGGKVKSIKKIRNKF